MNILHVASEGYPFIKTGGLGDVIGALPKALQEQGVNVQVILPKYQDIAEHFKEEMELIEAITVPVGWRNQYAGIERLVWNGIVYYFIDNEYYFKRSGSYGYFDDGERFSYFCRAVLEALPYLDERPDILHCHDWQTGMVSLLKKAHFYNHPFYKDMKTVFTIHNLRYQGVYPKVVLHDLLDLSELYFTVDGVEFYGKVNFMKAGLVYSDLVTTVSPTYAHEIQTPYFGESLHGLLRKRSNELVGIVNGIDYELYNPDTDETLAVNFDSRTNLKFENKLSLQQELGLGESAETPMIAIITRLVEQKGIDLILHVLDQIMRLDVQLVVLGTGEEKYERAFREAEQRYPGKLSAHIYFDDNLARKMYAASDMFLMPSQFEPCGISQLLALRYGSLPIVRETGGLKDTVLPYNQYTEEGHGFSFANYNAHEMLEAIERATALFHQYPITWNNLVKRAMELDFSWKSSSEKYKQLYEGLTPHKTVDNYQTSSL
ncbi:glycogen synthase GlgA [Pseudalkalibacillus caeni]|uniref:Glycogen synthase n=1 Tax=Exobacillus caeni TaxID=2574798 RepID=A0A5R9F9H6_9BACL|nr:glycogen synthase GlgA [Pseudalkalibacillus caeni]TLS37513.1 glycogen synthase GlgA [Pseudalkalibacillus caeni]